ncbi:fibronectin type III domain-containing protein [bacterium]|nr:fibronectin type III domain-containing protein [bacterium]
MITSLFVLFLFMIGVPVLMSQDVVPSEAGVDVSNAVPDGSNGLTDVVEGEPSVQEVLPEIMIPPPEQLVVIDVPNDSGGAISMTWSYPKAAPKPDKFVIERKEKGSTEFEQLGRVSPLTNDYTDNNCTDGTEYIYRVGTQLGDQVVFSGPSQPVSSTDHWFNWARFNVFIGSIVICSLILLFIQMARSGRELYIRRIAGLSAVEEAIGRATEMGKPILFVPGIGYIEDVATIAALNLLGEITKRIVNYNVRLICPNFDPIVFTVAREIVKETYTAEGRPDYYNPNSVFFVVNNQFAYAAAVDGIMLREKPATNFFMGYFSAESLILAETGAMTGAIQIAGTDCISQLPFFITACDYTLIGEELYASSAYLSKNALLLGTLKGQDYSKLVIIVAIIAFSILNLIWPDLGIMKFFKTGGSV